MYFWVCCLVSFGFLQSCLAASITRRRSANLWHAHGHMPAPAALAVVDLHEASGSGVKGTLRIRPYGQNRLIIYGTIYGLEPGTHGFHVHEHGTIGNDCMDAGGHFNPHQTEDHVGDLGTIFTPVSGPTLVNVVDDVITHGDKSIHDIAGLSIVVHGSREAGQGAPRVACGVIVDYVEESTDVVSPSPLEPAGRAVVELIEAQHSGVTGTLIVEPIKDGSIRIVGTVFGLEPGTHGFHVHEHGEIGNDCKDAGGHFNPYNTEEHVGDLGTIFTPESGVTEVDIVDNVITLGDAGFHDINGLSIVIHGSREAGKGKPRVACGLINYMTEMQK